jgi:predicted nucleic acid-binding protein
MANIDISTINTSSIDSSEEFYIDTNILAYLHFGFLSKSWDEEKISAYSNFIACLLNNKNIISVSTLTLQELIHLLERLECIRICGNAKVKKFRRMLAEREKMEIILKAIISQIGDCYRIVDDKVSRIDIDNILKNYSSHLYDPIDFIIVDHHRKHHKYINFITDDADFRNDTSINVYYCN